MCGAINTHRGCCENELAREEEDRLGPAIPVSQAACSWQSLAAVPHVLQSAGGSATEME